jgi:hypothetical protein
LSDSHVTESENNEQKPAKPSCNLERLHFFECTFVGPQLVNFVQSPQPRLKELSLSNLKGVTNSDMLEMFLIVAPTVTHLYISYCTIARSTGEEFAIDVAISKMVALQSLSIAGDCGTELSMLRAATNFREPRQDRWVYHPLPHISLSHLPNMNPAKLPEALQVSPWASVALYDPGISSADESLKQELQTIAAARAIDLKMG